MVQLTAATDRLALLDLYTRTRALTEALAEPLSPEDQTAQSMPDVSPTKWHRAHTSWFFETFVLGPHARSYRVYDPRYAYLFNSYYETVGRFFPRSHRGVLTRPGAAEVGRYRTYVDEAMSEFTGSDVDEAVAQIIELGCHHEAQHQELILMDIKHVLAQNPLRPAYRRAAQGDTESGPSGVTWITHEGGVAEVGHTGTGFAFDNESPRHHVYLEPFQLAAAPVTNGEWLGFMDDGGYSRADLWLSDGWATVRDQGWSSPLYWDRVGSTWEQFTLGGMKPVRAEDPVCHISYYEADAFARWGGARLPTEEEWEVVAAGNGPEGSHFLDLDRLHPQGSRHASSALLGPALFGDVWQWTSSAYGPYPGYQPGPGALGEYNGKFMVNQYVLRGGSAVSPLGHLRATYRNFFPATARWAFSGLRLARNA